MMMYVYKLTRFVDKKQEYLLTIKPVLFNGMIMSGLQMNQICWHEVRIFVYN